MTLMIALLLLAGCSKDSDNEEDGQNASKNVVAYNGTSYNVIGARFENVMSQGEVTSIPIELYLNEDGSNYLSVQVERDDLGKQLDLTDRSSLYWITFNYGDTHYSWYRTTGMSSAYNLSDGSKVSVTRMDNGEYSIDVTVIYVSGVTENRLTAHYEGTVYNNWVDK